MFINYIFVLVGLVAATYIPVANTVSVCSCFCCDGSRCEPIPEGSFDIPSCDGAVCLTDCRKKFPLSCGGAGTGAISASCSDVTGSTSTATSASTSSPTTTAITTSITSETTSTITTSTTATTTSTITTNTTSETTSTITTSRTSETTSTTTTSITVTTTTPITTTTTTTVMTGSSGVSVIRETPRLITLLSTFIFIIAKIMF